MYENVFQKEQCKISNILCFVFGAVVTQIISWGQFRIKHLVANNENTKPLSNNFLQTPTVWFMITSRIFSVIWGFSDVYMWKGIWDGVDCFFAEGEKDWIIAASTLSIGVVVLTIAGENIGC